MKSLEEAITDYLKEAKQDLSELRFDEAFRVLYRVKEQLGSVPLPVAFEEKKIRNAISKIREKYGLSTPTIY